MTPINAVRHISRMRGGTQSHMMLCDDGHYYVVKFRNNPQGDRILANEMLATLLAERLGLPVPAPRVVSVSQELIDNSPDMRVGYARGDVPPEPGLHFGSRVPVDDPLREPVYDILPDNQLRDVVNLRDFLGMLVFDKWTCNTDGRQTIFYRDPSNPSRYRTLMIDNGFCFNAGEWGFPDSPIRGLYLRLLVYADVYGLKSFEPWLTRLRRLNWNEIRKLRDEIPAEWYGTGDLDGLLDKLDHRRKLIPSLIQAARDSAFYNPSTAFPNWQKAPRIMAPAGRTHVAASSDRTACGIAVTQAWRPVAAEANCHWCAQAT